MSFRGPLFERLGVIGTFFQLFAGGFFRRGHLGNLILIRIQIDKDESAMVAIDQNLFIRHAANVRGASSSPPKEFKPPADYWELTIQHRIGIDSVA
jgi:hypothetical protein